MPLVLRATSVLCLIFGAHVAHAALPSVGTQIGVSAEDVKAAMARAGCPLQSMAVERGKVAATCHDTAGVGWKVVIDPTTGRVTEVAPAD